MDIKQQSTGNNDSVEDAVIAIMNIKTTEGKLINFNAQVTAVYDALEERDLYTTPRSREWVGLSDEERYLNEGRSPEEIEYARAIEAKLREKNNGT